MVFFLPWWQATPVVPLSNDSWSMSFAKYLELRFYGHQYTRRANAEPCGHSIHKDYHQYFSYNQMVASFRWTSSISIVDTTVQSSLNYFHKPFTSAIFGFSSWSNDNLIYVSLLMFSCCFLSIAISQWDCWRSACLLLRSSSGTRAPVRTFCNRTSKILR